MVAQVGTKPPLPWEGGGHTSNSERSDGRGWQTIVVARTQNPK